jgi:hypothetical protein
VLVALLVLEIPAEAASFTAGTSLTIRRRPTGPVDRGTVVKIVGRLRSGKRLCRRNKRVQLIRIGRGPVARTRTNRFGKYRFDRRIRRTQRLRVRFRGFVTGVHPNIKTCLASRSRTIKVRVR